MPGWLAEDTCRNTRVEIHVSSASQGLDGSACKCFTASSNDKHNTDHVEKCLLFQLVRLAFVLELVACVAETNVPVLSARLTRHRGLGPDVCCCKGKQKLQGLPVAVGFTRLSESRVTDVRGVHGTDQNTVCWCTKLSLL